MNGKECLQCGTPVVGGDCAVCDSAGRVEAMAMVAILTLIALGLGFFVWLSLI